MQIKILIADDSPMIRRMVRSFIESHTSWSVCGEVGDGKAAAEKVSELGPDVVLLDLAMPVMDGLAAARRIYEVAPNTQIIMFTVHYYEELIAAAHRIGVKCVLPKSGTGSLQQLQFAIAEMFRDKLPGALK